MNAFARAVVAFALLSFGLPSPALAADCVVISGGRVFDGQGRLSETPVHLVIEDGHVAARFDADSPFSGAAGADGRGTWGDRDCAWIDAEGKQVARGFVDPVSSIGLVEVGMEAASRNNNPGGPDPIRASVVITDAYDPSSIVIAPARIQGITSAIVHPSGGMVSGAAGWVNLAGDTQAEAVADPTVAMRVALVTSSRAGGLAALRELFDDVRDYDRNRSSYDRNQRRDYIASRRDLEALVPVVRGELPIVLSADRAADIEALLRFVEEQRVRLIIDGGAEAHFFAQALATARIPVIVSPYVYGAGSFHQIRARRDGPRLLDEAGVSVLFSVRSAHFMRNLRQHAGNAVREGMDHAAAMAALTAGAAAAFGVPDRATLEVGAIADLVVWSGDPLELGSRAERMFINGQEVPLTGRQEALLERYRTLPGTPVPALSLP
jgi:hypothetical protein